MYVHRNYIDIYSIYNTTVHVCVHAIVYYEIELPVDMLTRGIS